MSPAEPTETSVCRDPTVERPCRYAAGLPLHATRPLTEPERSWLEQRLRRLERAVVLAGLGITITVAGAPLLAPHVPRLALPFSGGLGLGLVTLGLVGVLMCLAHRGWWRRLALMGALALAGALAIDLWISPVTQPRWVVAELVVGMTVLGLSQLGSSLGQRVRLLRRASRIRADLAAGVVERFEAPAPRAPLEGVLARLHHAGYVDGRAGVRLDVLPRSGVVLRVGGRRLERWETAHRVDIAPAQPHALRIELPRGVAPTQPDPRMLLKRRSLTAQERAELQRHIGHLRRRWWPVSLLTVVVVGLVAWDLYTATPSDALPLGGTTLGWIAMLGLVCVGHVRRELAARKLEHDRRLRWVVTVHQDAADPGCDPPSLEVLPISQLAWTERAAPAGWRLSRL